MLETGHLEGAGLDVFEREPLDDERLRTHPRVVMTPHSAFYSVEGFEELRRKAAEEVRRILLGEPVLNPVNRHCLVPRPRPGGAGAGADGPEGDENCRFGVSGINRKSRAGVSPGLLK